MCLVDLGGCAHELAILMNSAYATLSDPKARQLYDADLQHMRQHIGTFDGRPVSAWKGGPGMLEYHGKVLEIHWSKKTCSGSMSVWVHALVYACLSGPSVSAPDQHSSDEKQPAAALILNGGCCNILMLAGGLSHRYGDN